MTGLYLSPNEALWGNILDFNSPEVDDENDLGAFDEIKTSIFIIFQSEIAPLN